MTHRRRIDTHQHIVPPFYARWLEQQGMTAGGLPIPQWSAEGALELMGAAGIETAILSVSTPGVHLGDGTKARAMARSVNEYAAQVCADHPGRFGFFATLTLPDIDGALAETSHAFDVLQADGIVLLANTHGTYLGDASLEPLMAELDRRQAVVFIHPSALPAQPVPGLPPFAADFLLDTTRAALNITKASWHERFPRVRMILSHAGGFLPFAAERMARICSPDGSYERGIELLRRFHFDTALSGSPYAMPSLMAFADPGRVTFGSDWPYASQERALHFTQLLDRFEMPASQRQAIDRDNAAKLFPRFA